MENKYKILEADSSTDLQDIVNFALNNGYKPLGRPIINSYDNGERATFYQAVVKKEPV